MGFDEFLNKSDIDSMTNPYDAARDGFKAGAESRQSEINELKAELKTLQGMHNSVSLEAGNLVEERDELQKNFNNAVKTIEIQQRFLDDADGANKFLIIQVEELQNRVDKALIEINIYYDSDGMEDICLCDIGEILKGKKDE